jgi:adenine-specific DNA-methyltransferase
MIAPRLFLIKELLSDQGSVLIHLDWHVGHYVKIIADEIFGKDNFINEIIWKRTFAHGDTGQGASHLGRVHDAIYLYKKGEKITLNIKGVSG